MSEEIIKKEKKAVPAGKVVGLIVVFFIFLAITNPAVIPFLSPETKEKLEGTWSRVFGDVTKISETFKFNFATLFQIIAIILLMSAISAVILFIAGKLNPKSAKAKSFLTLIKSATSYIAFIVGFFWCLAAIGVNVSTIFASVGILTLVVGFGAQSLVEDLITGVFLVFEDQFNVGDIIEVGGYRGTVESIGIRTTAIKDVGGNIKLINNSDLRNILNRSATDSVAVTTVSVSYGTDIEKVEKVFETLLPEIRTKYSDVFIEDPKYIGVQTLGESGIELKIIGKVNEKDIFSAARLLNREIKIGFDKNGIEIPFNQIVVHQAK
ncbi:MAG: mechanosensitive ion channel family protein [Lachnospiraceae bacterium]|nr:mechanosensitive ion channel family protein [Lachnospiraceae bacterium]